MRASRATKGRLANYSIPSSVPVVSSVEVESTARRFPIARVKVSNAVQYLDSRVATSLSKELSNSVSRASWFALKISWASKVVEAGFNGPKGVEALCLSARISESLTIFSNCSSIFTLLLHCSFGSCCDYWILLGH